MMERSRRSRRLAGALFALALALAVLLQASARGQWSSWRGPFQNGTSLESGLPTRWSKDGENLAWKVPIGSRSTPLVIGNRVYLLTRGGKGATEHERVVCLSAAAGATLWEHKTPIFLTDIPSNRVGWTSLAGDPETGIVYAHGVQGLFYALDRDGKLVWSHSLNEEFGRFSGYGGRLMNPLVDEDLVIVSFLNSSWGDHGRMWHRFLAADKRTGAIRWWSSPGEAPLDTNYSAPVVAVINGMRLLVVGSGDGAVHALKVRTGEPVWRFRLSKRGINSSVVVDGTTVFASHSEENLDSTEMGRLVAIDGTGTGDVTATKELWRVEGLQAGYASPAIHDGLLYVVDNSANLDCYTAKDGKRIWRHSLGTVGKGSPVWADGKIYVTEVNERFHIVKVSAAGCEPLDEEKFPAADGTKVEVNGSPAVAHGRIYFSTRDETFAIGPKDVHFPGQSPAPVIPEPPGDPQAAAAHLQVVPADCVARPGEKIQLQGRLFDAQGRFLRPAEKLALTLKGLRGAATDDSFTPAAEAPWQSGSIEAKAGELAATVRVRVVSPLPQKFDFDKLEPGKQIPAGWIGMSPLKFQIVERDGGRVLQKLADNPRFMRADVSIGLPEWANYIVQADVLGTYARRNLPDIGLTCCRYNLILTKDQKTGQRVLRAVGWLPMPRVQMDAPFEWKQDAWYRMKMRVDKKGEAGVVKGKVWPRGEPEPAAWTLEMEDPQPTFSGAPGFTAFSPGITDRSPGPLAFFDNIEITENRN